MAWPPPVFPSTFTNATNQLDDHPNIHNEINASLNNDFRPKIDDNAARIAVNDGLIIDNAADLAAHADTDDTSRTKFFNDTSLDFQNDDANAPVVWLNNGVAASFRTEGLIRIQYSHRRVYVQFHLTVQSNVTGVSPGAAQFRVDMDTLGFPARPAGDLKGGAVGASNDQTNVYEIGVAHFLSNQNGYCRYTVRKNGASSGDTNISPGGPGAVYFGDFAYGLN